MYTVRIDVLSKHIDRVFSSYGYAQAYIRKLYKSGIKGYIVYGKGVRV